MIIAPIVWGALAAAQGDTWEVLASFENAKSPSAVAWKVMRLYSPPLAGGKTIHGSLQIVGSPQKLTLDQTRRAIRLAADRPKKTFARETLNPGWVIRFSSAGKEVDVLVDGASNRIAALQVNSAVAPSTSAEWRKDLVDFLRSVAAQKTATKRGT